jgi:hypothetical protein
MEPEFDAGSEVNEADKKNHGHHHDKDGECEHEHPHHGPGHGPRPELPPHILRELMDMKEKIGKLEGMMEVILKKLD